MEDKSFIFASVLLIFSNGREKNMLESLKSVEMFNEILKKLVYVITVHVRTALQVKEIRYKMSLFI